MTSQPSAEYAAQVRACKACRSPEPGICSRHHPDDRAAALAAFPDPAALIRDLHLLHEALDATEPGAEWTESKIVAFVRTLDWALNLTEGGRLALARELGTLRARREASAT